MVEEDGRETHSFVSCFGRLDLFLTKPAPSVRGLEDWDTPLRAFDYHSSVDAALVCATPSPLRLVIPLGPPPVPLAYPRTLKAIRDLSKTSGSSQRSVGALAHDTLAAADPYPSRSSRRVLSLANARR